MYTYSSRMRVTRCEGVVKVTQDGCDLQEVGRGAVRKRSCRVALCFLPERAMSVRYRTLLCPTCHTLDAMEGSTWKRLREAVQEAAAGCLRSK